MSSNIIELVLLLDRSGSMNGLESDTIGGFNSLIEKQKKQDGACFVSTVLFDHETEVLYDRVPIEKVGVMTQKEYFTRGSTALIDALGGAIDHISTIHRYIRQEDVPQHTMFVVTTDGMENASRKYTAEKVRAMIEEKKTKCGWEFLFIGANIDAVTTAAQYGISDDRAVNYNADSRGTGILFDAIEKAVGRVRRGEVLDPCWCESLNEDYEKRGRK